MKQILIIIGVVIATLCAIVNATHNVHHQTSNEQDVMSTINKLLELIQDSQFKETTEYKMLETWAEQKGLFPSEIHLNFCGDPLKTEARRLFQIPDENMFVTNFIIYTLLQSERLGVIQPSKDVINNGIEAILSYKDRNYPDGSGVYTFWPQVYNESMGIYSEFPSNLYNLVDSFGSFQKVVDAFADVFKLYGILDDMKSIAAMLDIFKVAFRIPPDSDDTGCNLALGNILFNLNNNYNDAWDMWKGNNTNYQFIIDKYIKYSYQPFSDNSDSNSIDPRTFYAIYGFLNQQFENGQLDVMLPTTWMMSITEQIATFPFLQMPFNVNNLDFSVMTNSLFGIVNLYHQAVTQQQQSKDQQLIFNEIENQMVPSFYNSNVSVLVSSIADILVWGIENNVVFNRTDITLLYYPSIYDFGWFVSRLVFQLEEFNTTMPQQFPPTFNTVLQQLRDVMEVSFTNELIKRVQAIPDSGYLYWDDFLGDDDTNILGKPVQHGDDRFFSTSLSINTLYDVWSLPVYNTTSSGNGQLSRVWKETTPKLVQSIVARSVEYVNDNILKEKDMCYNAFFSGSMKGLSTYAYVYPSNVCRYLNGTACNPHINEPNGDEIVSPMSGFVEQSEYTNMVQDQLWANQTTPTNWSGFNPSSFPYWSSTPLTYSVSLLALSKSIILK